MSKKTVFITGVTGSMGGAGLKELLRRRDRFNLVTLVRPSAVNKRKLRKLFDEPGLRIVWGDLTCYEDVLECVTGADIVLHPAAMIAPAADHNPEAARAVNVGSVENILKAIKAQPDPAPWVPVQCPSRQASFARFPSPHETMERHAGPILGKWAGQSLLAG